VSGVNIAGLGVVGLERVRWLSLTAGGIESARRIEGFALGAYRVKSPEITGASLSALMVRTRDLHGLAVASYTRVRGTQRGVSIGLFNDANRLHGVQIGLLNRVRRSDGSSSILPLVNARFDH
jgi:hypothetical protein